MVKSEKEKIRQPIYISDVQVHSLSYLTPTEVRIQIQK